MLPSQFAGNSTTISTTSLEEKARSGRRSDVDFMMAQLQPAMPFLASRLVNYGLGLITNGQGAGESVIIFSGAIRHSGIMRLIFQTAGKQSFTLACCSLEQSG
jgi:hypothetical protein